MGEVDKNFGRADPDTECGGVGGGNQVWNVGCGRGKSSFECGVREVACGWIFGGLTRFFLDGFFELKSVF